MLVLCFFVAGALNTKVNMYVAATYVVLMALYFNVAVVPCVHAIMFSGAVAIDLLVPGPF